MCGGADPLHGFSLPPANSFQTPPLPFLCQICLQDLSPLCTPLLSPHWGSQVFLAAADSTLHHAPRKTCIGSPQMLRQILGAGRPLQLPLEYTHDDELGQKQECGHVPQTGKLQAKSTVVNASCCGYFFKHQLKYEVHLLSCGHILTMQAQAQPANRISQWMHDDREEVVEADLAPSEARILWSDSSTPTTAAASEGQNWNRTTTGPNVPFTSTEESLDTGIVGACIARLLGYNLPSAKTRRKKLHRMAEIMGLGAQRHKSPSGEVFYMNRLKDVIVLEVSTVCKFLDGWRSEAVSHQPIDVKAVLLIIPLYPAVEPACLLQAENIPRKSPILSEYIHAPKWFDEILAPMVRTTKGDFLLYEIALARYANGSEVPVPLTRFYREAAEMKAKVWQLGSIKGTKKFFIMKTEPSVVPVRFCRAMRLAHSGKIDTHRRL
ncbi:hypothetical protein BDK51DRAFT_35021 [Blyttiomyces helicus]|uniref:Uncharacterized protein n=1 Tax=Blyttiomyces helicus TaxID=388810 RepID=A0A4P9VZV9_9FUNG|nr:hypothetical protein BDK51DRAFT_35021 [Blyttiomyces helicus]|eukprot:RKO84892.1 hypothetical protein BDK51DRAFT_35021 [Blyttiomyces helicus]